MLRQKRRWLLLLFVLLLLAGLLAAGVYGYTVVPPSLAKAIEERAEFYYKEMSGGPSWDTITAMNMDGGFRLHQVGPGLLDIGRTWCVTVEARGQTKGRAVTGRSRWRADPIAGGWAVSIINVPWSSQSSGPC